MARRSRRSITRLQLHNIVFEGGGVHGIGYIGGLAALEEAGQLNYIQKTGGASIGTLAAVATACRVRPQQLMEDALKLTKDVLTGEIGKWKMAYNATFKLGVYDLAKAGGPWVRALLQKYAGNGDITFRGIHDKYSIDPFLVVYNRTRSRPEVISVESDPDMPVAPVIIAGMSFPGYFTPQKLPGRGDDLFIDGGITNNFPLYLFDPPSGVCNRRTIGFRSVSNQSAYFAPLTGHEVPLYTRGAGRIEYIKGIVASMIESGQQRYERPCDAARTCFMVFPDKIGALDFDLDNDTKWQLYNIGRDCVAQFIGQ